VRSNWLKALPEGLSVGKQIVLSQSFNLVHKFKLVASSTPSEKFGINERLGDK